MNRNLILIFSILLSASSISQNNNLVPVHLPGKSPVFGVEEFWAIEFSKQLRSLGEENIQNLSCDGELYRFLWLRSFHNPIVFVVSKRTHKIEMEWKRSDARGDFETGKIVEQRIIPISESQWREFQNLIEKSKFWTNETFNPENTLTLDGAQWLFEGLKNNHYHISLINVEQLGRYIIETSGLRISEKDIY